MTVRGRKEVASSGRNQFRSESKGCKKAICWEVKRKIFEKIINLTKQIMIGLKVIVHLL